jgi:serine/threonine protein kinase
MTILELYTGEMPFKDVKGFVEIFQFYKTNEVFEPTFDDSCSALFKDFVQQCLIKNPKDRPTAVDMLVVTHTNR